MSRPGMTDPIHMTGSYIPLIVAAWAFSALVFIIVKYGFGVGS